MQISELTITCSGKNVFGGEKYRKKKSQKWWTLCTAATPRSSTGNLLGPKITLLCDWLIRRDYSVTHLPYISDLGILNDKLCYGHWFLEYLGF